MANLIIALFIFLNGTGIVLAKDYPIKSGNVSFNTIASPSFLSIDGKGGNVTGSIKIDAGFVSALLAVKLDEFDTGTELRNEHMKFKYLDVKKYPYAVLAFKGLKEQDKGEFEGALTLKKETKPVTVSYEIKDNVVYAKFAFKVKDYPSVGVPSYLGVTAADIVNVSVELPLKR